MKAKDQSRASRAIYHPVGLIKDAYDVGALQIFELHQARAIRIRSKPQVEGVFDVNDRASRQDRGALDYAQQLPPIPGQAERLKRSLDSLDNRSSLFPSLFAQPVRRATRWNSIHCPSPKP